MDTATGSEESTNSVGVVDTSGVLYGVLAVATVVAAESTLKENFDKLVLASVVTMAMYWLAHAYSHHWASRVRRPDGWNFSSVSSSLIHQSGVLLGAAVPVAVLVATWLAGASRETGVTAVLWTSGVEVVALEVVPALRHHLGALEVLKQASMGVALGLGVLVLRIVLH